MNRPTGVILSAVCLSLLSALQLLSAAGMLIGGLIMRHAMDNSSGITSASGGPEVALAAITWMRFGVIVMAGFCLALAVWGIVTVVGLIRLRNWARISILIIAVCVTCGGLLTLFGAVVGALFVPAAGNQTGTSPIPPAAMMHLIFGIEAFFCLLVVGVGVWWLVYFNQRATKAYFQPTVHWPAMAGMPDPQLDPYASSPVYAVSPAASQQGGGHFPPGPLAIKIFGWLALASSAMCLIGTLMPFPAFFLGQVVSGASKVALYICLATTAAYIGWGLLHLREAARRVAIGFVGFGLLQGLLMLFPPFMHRLLAYSDNISRSMTAGMPIPVGAYHANTSLTIFSMVFGAVIGIVFNSYLLWLLHRYRSAFQPPATSAMGE